MTYSLKILGNNKRHITSFEKIQILRLNRFVEVSDAKLFYDETLYDVDNKYYLLLNITFNAGSNISVTTEGDTKFEALIKGVSLVRERFLRTGYNNTTPHIHISRSPLPKAI